MITTLDNFDANTFFANATLHPQFERVIPEYVKLAKRSLYNYKDVTLYVPPTESNKVEVFYGNYRVGGLKLIMKGATHKVLSESLYVDLARQDFSSVNATAVAKHMVQTYVRPDIGPDMRTMWDAVDTRIRNCVNFWGDKAKLAYTKGCNAVDSSMHFDEYQSPMVQRVISLLMLLEEREPSKDDVTRHFREWMEADVPETITKYHDAMNMRRLHESKRVYSTRLASRPLLSDCAYVREYSDGTGVFITGNERHYLTDMEQLPVEVMEKVALLKVSGLDYIHGVGVSGGTFSLHDSLNESIYFLIRS
jgi:hypothetical protein